MEEPEAAAAGPSEIVRWEIPGRDVVVEIAPRTLEGLLLEALSGLGLLARGRGVESGGVLLGWTHTEGPLHRIRIEDFRLVGCRHAHGPSYVLAGDEQEELRRTAAAWARRPGRRRYFVGYWRSHARGPLELRRQDRDLLEALGPLRPEIALLIEPHGAGPGTVALFMTSETDGEATRPAVTYETAPIRSARGGGAAPDVVHADAPAPVASHDRDAEDAARDVREFRFSMFEAPAREAAPPPQRRRRWLKAATAFLLVVLVGASGVALLQGRLQLPWSGAGEDPYALGLRVESYGENLRVTWERSSGAIQLAEQGLLTITDGDRLQVIELDRRQLLAGSVVYRPIGDQVSFRLELTWDKHSLVERAGWVASPQAFR